MIVFFSFHICSDVVHGLFFQNLKITDELSEGNYGIGEYHETHRPAVVENDNVQPNVSYGQIKYKTHETGVGENYNVQPNVSYGQIKYKTDEY